MKERSTATTLAVEKKIKKGVKNMVGLARRPRFKQNDANDGKNNKNKHNSNDDADRMALMMRIQHLEKSNEALQTTNELLSTENRCLKDDLQAVTLSEGILKEKDARRTKCISEWHSSRSTKELQRSLDGLQSRFLNLVEEKIALQRSLDILEGRFVDVDLAEEKREETEYGEDNHSGSISKRLDSASPPCLEEISDVREIIELLQKWFVMQVEEKVAFQVHVDDLEQSIRDMERKLQQQQQQPPKLSHLPPRSPRRQRSRGSAPVTPAKETQRRAIAAVETGHSPVPVLPDLLADGPTTPLTSSQHNECPSKPTAGRASRRSSLSNMSQADMLQQVLGRKKQREWTTRKGIFGEMLSSRSGSQHSKGTASFAGTMASNSLTAATTVSGGSIPTEVHTDGCRADCITCHRTDVPPSIGSRREHLSRENSDLSASIRSEFVVHRQNSAASLTPSREDCLTEPEQADDDDDEEEESTPPKHLGEEEVVITPVADNNNKKKRSIDRAAIVGSQKNDNNANMSYRPLEISRHIWAGCRDGIVTNGTMGDGIDDIFFTGGDGNGNDTEISTNSAALQAKFLTSAMKNKKVSRWDKFLESVDENILSPSKRRRADIIEPPQIIDLSPTTSLSNCLPLSIEPPL